MTAPVIAGVVVNMLALEPSLNINQIKSRLTRNSKSVDNCQGNCRAVVTGCQGSVSTTQINR